MERSIIPLESMNRHFRETYQWLTEQKVTEEREIGSVEITGWLGLNSKEMWNTFCRNWIRAIKSRQSTMVGDLMIRQIRKHKAVWYPGSRGDANSFEEPGISPVILSNCKASYREAHWKEFGMERWFDRFMTVNHTDSVQRQKLCRKSSGNIVAPYLVVGDRRQDLECARSCKKPFIGCLYGYGEKGELNGADYYAEHIEDIPADGDMIFAI